MAASHNVFAKVKTVVEFQALEGRANEVKSIKNKIEIFSSAIKILNSFLKVHKFFISIKFEK